MAKSSRNREELNEATSAAWQAQQDNIHLRRKLAAAETKITALENILIDKLNIPREAILAEQQKAEEQRTAPKKAEACPQCSRPLQEHVRACIYCGHVK